MDLWLAYEIVLGLGLVIALAWVYDARRLLERAARLIELHDDQPTEEIDLPPTMRIGSGRLEDLGGPARPVPPDWGEWWSTKNQPERWPL